MRTLVVEDSSSIRELLESLLGERGHQVVGVETAEQGLLQHRIAPFDLLLIDLVLPGMSGLELARLVRAGRDGDAPVIVAFTGRRPGEGLDDLLEGGIDDYLTKPLAPDLLRQRLSIAESQVRKAKRRFVAERERRRLRARMQQADRLSSVGTLAVGVAHELNNPLASVTSNLTLLREELERLDGVAPERMRTLTELVADATEGAARMRVITADLETFTDARAERTATVDVRTVLASTLRSAQNALRHRARLVAELGEVPAVQVSPGRLAQVFLNVLAWIAAGDAEATDRVVRVRSGTTAGGKAVVEISDSARVLSRYQAERAFDPYESPEAVHESSGLGLSVCHNLVTAMGGSIEVRSREGEGTSFRVLLEPAAQARASADVPPAPVPSPSPVRLRVLIVDDEVLVARSLRRALVGHEVVVAESGDEAAGRILDDGRFDVILCDLMMPGTTGMDVYEQVTRRAPDLAGRFVFMTGGAFTPRARAFLERVPNERLEKPFDIQRVRSLVASRAPR